MENLKIYALTDSHQETRNLSTLFSYIYQKEQNNNNKFLILDSGDIFKGIYKKDLSVNAYIKLKELLPHSEIFITLGNNDFGFCRADFNYLLDTVEKFKNIGINVICANLVNKSGFAEFVDRYKILDFNDEKILITGFCVNNSCVKKFGYELLSQIEAYRQLLNDINEPLDKVFVLNHNWLGPSVEFCDEIKKDNKLQNISLIIGGHEHSRKEPDFERNIYYPMSFARSIYDITFNNNNIKADEIMLNDIKIEPIFEKPIIEYELETELYKPIIKRVLNLTKKYSDPCPLGTFISDYMKKFGNTDIAFHSTGFTMNQLSTNDSDCITKYDFEKVICAATTIEKVDLTTMQIKSIFEHALRNRICKDKGNAQFLQCSNNIKIVGTYREDKTYKIMQIYINNNALLDENCLPIDNHKTFSCTIDSYIGTGEQGFSMLKDLEKEIIFYSNEELKINKVLYLGLLEAENLHKNTTNYKCFEIIDLE